MHHLDQATSAKIAWDTLERTFGAKGKHSKISLKMQLYSLTMHDNETLSSVVNRLKSICTQLTYIQCNIDEDDKIAILLKSLPITYEHIVTVLKEKEPVPSLESIIHSLQEEENKHTHTNEAPISQALYVSNSKKACKHCGKTNHSSQNCFKIKKCVKCGKIGHPPQFFPKGGNGGSNGGKNGGSSSKGRHIHYARSDDDDSDENHNGDDDNINTDEGIHLVSVTSSPHASSSTSSTSFSNKNHVKGSPTKGKKMYYYSSDDDIL